MRTRVSPTDKFQMSPSMEKCPFEIRSCKISQSSCQMNNLVTTTYIINKVIDRNLVFSPSFHQGNYTYYYQLHPGMPPNCPRKKILVVREHPLEAPRLRNNGKTQLLNNFWLGSQLNRISSFDQELTAEKKQSLIQEKKDGTV